MGKSTKTPFNVRLSDDELALLERVAAKHGGKTAAVVAGLRALDEGKAELSNAALLAEIKRRLK